METEFVFGSVVFVFRGSENETYGMLVEFAYPFIFAKEISIARNGRYRFVDLALF